MIATVTMHYSELLDHWSWEVTVDGCSTYSFDTTYEDALDRVRDVLEEMLEVDE